MTQPSTTSRLPRWEIPLALAWYLAGAALLTHRVWGQAGDVVLGDVQGADLTGTIWTWWWTAHALITGANPADCPLVYYPVGFFPVAQFNVVDALVAAPFVATLGPLAGLNVAVALILASSGLAVHAVARWEGADHVSATFAGTALMASGFMAGEIVGGRVSQAFIASVVLAIGLWLRVFRGEGTWRLALVAGVTSAVAFLEYWYYGLFVAFAVLAVFPLLWRADRARLGRVALGALTTVVLILPLVLVLLDRASVLPGMVESDGWTDQGPLGRGEAGLNWALISSLWPLWPVYVGGGPGIDATLPRVLLLVALAPLLVYRRRRWTWLAIGGVGWVLSLGPYLQSYDVPVEPGVPLPYLWLYDGLPFFKRFWWPYRAAVLAEIALVVLAARNITEIRAEAGRWGGALAWGLVALVAAEATLRSDYLPIPTSLIEAPSEAYASIEGPMLTLPIFSDDETSRYALLLQTAHHQPISLGLGAHIDGHRPPAIDALVAHNGFLSLLRAIEDEPVAAARVSPADIQELIDRGFVWVVADRTVYADNRRLILDDMLAPTIEAVLGEPDVQDDRVRAWRLRVPEGAVVLDPVPGWQLGAP